MAQELGSDTQLLVDQMEEALGEKRQPTAIARIGQQIKAAFDPAGVAAEQQQRMKGFEARFRMRQFVQKQKEAEAKRSQRRSTEILNIAKSLRDPADFLTHMQKQIEGFMPGVDFSKLDWKKPDVTFKGLGAALAQEELARRFPNLQGEKLYEAQIKFLSEAKAGLEDSEGQESYADMKRRAILECQKGDCRLRDDIQDQEVNSPAVRSYIFGQRRAKREGLNPDVAHAKGLEAFYAVKKREGELQQETRGISASAQRRIAGLMALQDLVKNVSRDYDSSFLGPIKGTDTAFEARRRVGGFLGTPLGARETIFRQALKDMADSLLRARSGAQINEQEYQRLRSMLPAATDEPQVFLAGLNRFRKLIVQSLESTRKVAITPKGDLLKPKTEATLRPLPNR
tara:strand:+ start:1230 stop:2426 length:1197 start_codon:yes stop_codon:yes gene_type:complete